MRQINWEAVADYIGKMSTQYLEDSLKAAASDRQQATVIHGATGHVLGNLAAALYAGLARGEDK